MIRHRFAVTLPLLLASCLPIVRLHTNEPFTAANVVLPSASIRSVHLDVNVGDVAFQRAPSDSIRLNAVLVSHDADRLANICSKSTRLIQESSDGTLRLRLEQSSRDQCGERWTVELPASLAVSASVRFGSVKGSVESNDVDVQVQQGDIELTTRAGDLELARVESNLGRVSLELRGMQVQPTTRPGRGAFAEVTGRGKGKVTAHTKHGSATLRVQ
jgi:hypothetical protein